ncbi:11826_t:CDS:2 [Scutellospora calospora]|uniref:11826_t:CDS:1 n=1 Tax=Scutellospora calospora TaxID=85575 RepID=A0ACA9KG61_9GLOM|nr:11826_t:CDS:2 [Scutellospora calospora]
MNELKSEDIQEALKEQEQSSSKNLLVPCLENSITSIVTMEKKLVDLV